MTIAVDWDIKQQNKQTRIFKVDMAELNYIPANGVEKRHIGLRAAIGTSVHNKETMCDVHYPGLLK